jgi:hypothetical protein
LKVLFFKFLSLVSFPYLWTPHISKDVLFLKKIFYADIFARMTVDYML